MMGEAKKPLSRSERAPINKRPGRVVCICTAKGKIIYPEERFTHNQTDQRR